MQAVKDILQAHGYDSIHEIKIGEAVEVELDSEAMMPPVIEKVADDRLSVAHYYEQNMDLVRDPEVVFRVDANGEWTAVEYIHDPFTYERDDDDVGLPDVQEFAEKQWSKNLREQGYVEAARAAASASSSSTEVTA